MPIFQVSIKRREIRIINRLQKIAYVLSFKHPKYQSNGILFVKEYLTFTINHVGYATILWRCF